MISPRSSSMGSNEDVVEGRKAKRRLNSGETRGILHRDSPETGGLIQNPTTASEPSTNHPPSQEQLNPSGYSITDNPLVPALQGSSTQPWYRPSFLPIGQQGDLPNFPGGTFPSAPTYHGLYPSINVTFQPPQYPVPSNGYGSNEVSQSQNIFSPPGNADLTSKKPGTGKTPRPGRRGTLKCARCRRHKRGVKAPCITPPDDPHGPCIPCRKNGHAETCGPRTLPQNKKKTTQPADPNLRLESVTTWVPQDDPHMHAASLEREAPRRPPAAASNMQKSETVQTQSETQQVPREANYSVESNVDTRDSDFLDPATSSQMETYPVSESFLPPGDHQPFSKTVVSTSLTTTPTGIIQQTTSTSTSFLSPPESAPDFPNNSPNRPFTTTDEIYVMHTCRYGDCMGNCINTPTDSLATSHQVASILFTHYREADPATINSAVNDVIARLERDRTRRQYPARQWTPSPVPLFRGQEILEPLSQAVPAQPTFSARRGPPIFHEFPEYDNLLGSDTGIAPGVFAHTPNINLADEPHIMSNDVQPDNDTEFDSSKNH